METYALQEIVVFRRDPHKFGIIYQTYYGLSKVKYSISDHPVFKQFLKLYARNRKPKIDRFGDEIQVLPNYFFQ